MEDFFYQNVDKACLQSKSKNTNEDEQIPQFNPSKKAKKNNVGF